MTGVRRHVVVVHALAVASMMTTTGCLAGYRFGVAATLDERARPGVIAVVGGTIGIQLSDRHAVGATTAIEGGVAEVRPNATGVIRGVLSLEWIAIWSRVGLRLGAAVGGGRLQAERGQTFGLVGLRVAVLPVVKRIEEVLTQGDCAGKRVARTLHVGIAASADYQFEADRHLFTLGPTFEGYRERCYMK